MNILENELADKAAKRETELQKAAFESYVSLAFIKRKIKESALNDWTKTWIESKNKNKHYNQFECKPKWKIAIKARISKKTWSACMQIKLEHDYFKSYLYKLSEYDFKNCMKCNITKNSKHLFLHCKKYS